MKQILSNIMEDIQGWNDSKFEYYFSGTSDEIPLSKEEMLELLCEKYSKDWYARTRKVQTKLFRRFT